MIDHMFPFKNGKFDASIPYHDNGSRALMLYLKTSLFLYTALD